MEQTWYVDIPSEAAVDDPEGPFINVGTFDTKEAAIAFAKDKFGADDEGKVCLVSGG